MTMLGYLGYCCEVLTSLHCSIVGIRPVSVSNCVMMGQSSGCLDIAHAMVSITVDLVSIAIAKVGTPTMRLPDNLEACPYTRPLAQSSLRANTMDDPGGLGAP